MEKPKETSEATNRRRNYYKNLGIGQKGSMENDRVVKGLAKINSGESKQPETEKFDKEFNKSFTSIAISKGKAMANVSSEDSPYLKKNLGSDKEEWAGENIIKDASQLVLDEIAEVDHQISSIDNEGNGTSNSMAETKADETDALEESKIDESTLETEKVESSYQNKEVEGFKLDFITRVQPKSMEQMRRKFLSKLTQEKIWLTPSEKPKSHQTWIIFDWDDTLLCTSFLNPTNSGNFDLPLNVKLQLKKLEKASFDLLSEWIKYGEVYIITNAADGWVEFSSKKYLPKLTKILEKVTVMSARACWEAEYPDEIHQWKMKAFLKTQEKMEKGAITNLVALGDSQFEMDAVKHLGAQFPRALIKTVKFRELPTPDELVKQINLVMMKLEQIWTSAKNLTIRLERKEGN